MISGGFIALLSLRVFGAYLRRNVPAGVEFLVVRANTREGLLLGVGIILVGGALIFISSRIDRLYLHLTRQQQLRDFRQQPPI